MDKGIFTATSGGLLEARRLQNVASNLSNANTPGFKSQRLVSRQQEFPDTLAGTVAPQDKVAKAQIEATPGVVTIGSQTDFSAGGVSHTGNPLDVAISEEGVFFVIQTPQGEEYTRAGNFTLNSERQLVTADGFPVSGDGGPIELPEGEIELTSSGNVRVNGQDIGKLRTVRIDDLKSLEHRGGTRFGFGASGGGAVDESVPLIVESVEGSNSTIVESMVEMIGLNRSFEAYSKVVKTLDELNDRAVRLARGVG